MNTFNFIATLLLIFVIGSWGVVLIVSNRRRELCHAKFSDIADAYAYQVENTKGIRDMVVISEEIKSSGNIVNFINNA